MSQQDFIDAYGAPRDPAPATRDEAEAARGRLPDALIDFWMTHGTGSYAKGHFRLCRPALFDDMLDTLLAQVPGLRGKLAAFAYRSTGQVDLWHAAGRHFGLLLPFAVIDDLTSRTETAPIPHDLADLCRAAGVEMPSDAVEIMRTARQAPDDIWALLSGGASWDGYRHDLGDDGRSLPVALQRACGSLNPGEIYCRKPGPAGATNIASAYERLTLREIPARLPATVTIVRTIEIDGQQRSVAEEYPAGRMPAA